jgi:perosamine synthetase
VEADGALMGATPRSRLTRLPPAGRALGIDGFRDVLFRSGSPGALEGTQKRLEQSLGGRRLALYGSAREGLVALLSMLRETGGRTEVVLPAYCCYSVAASAVAAGLRVRLVDVDARGRISLDHLASLPLEAACAVLVGNLFGLTEPIEPIVRLAGAAGCAVIDDAAQSFGAYDDSGVAGARGDYGLLSFGRGKPLSALGGGAVAWTPGRSEGVDEPAHPSARPGAGAIRALVHAIALQGVAFRILAAIPALRIGETVYEPDIRPGPIGAASLSLLGHALEHAEDDAARRVEVAHALAAEIGACSAWTPLIALSPARGVHPRLGVLAPDSRTRDAALRSLDRIGAGASLLYPKSLDAVPGLAEHRIGDPDCRGARSIAERILTLPTHGRLRGARRDDALAILARSD